MAIPLSINAKWYELNVMSNKSNINLIKGTNITESFPPNNIKPVTIQKLSILKL